MPNVHHSIGGGQLHWKLILARLASELIKARSLLAVSPSARYDVCLCVCEVV